MIDLRFLHEQLATDLSQILDSNLVILGCGAIGANLAISLARRGFCKFWLADSDRIEEHNISTQPWNEFDIGKMKVHVLGATLGSIARAEANTYSKRIALEKQVASWVPEDAVIVDCFDNHEARAIAQSVSRSWPVLHVGMSREGTAEVTWAEGYTVPPDIPLADPCNYPLSRTLIELSVVAAAEAIIRFLLSGTKTDYYINDSQLRIEIRER